MNQLDVAINAIDFILAQPLPSVTIEQYKLELKKYAQLALIGVLFNVAVIACFALFANPTMAAKFLLLEVMVVISAICFLVLRYQKDIMDVLEQLELLAELLRDQVFVEMATAREQMEHLRMRLVRDESLLKHSSALQDLIKSVGPIAMLFLQKETSAVRWGWAGLKVAQQAFAFFKERTQKSEP